MTTAEVAQKWAEYCQKGQWDLAHANIYHQDCESIESEGVPEEFRRVKGMDALAAKGKDWADSVEEFHGLKIEGPIVAGNYFSATMIMDVTFKGQKRKIDEEVCLFKVENGKIVSEQFFY